MFLYAESPEQERNTLSHLTEAFGLVFPNCTATFCSEEQFGVMERGWGGLQKKLFGGQVGEKEGDKGGTSRGQVGEAWSRVIGLFFLNFVCFRGGGGGGSIVVQEEGVLAGWKEKRARREGRGRRRRRRSGREASGREKGAITQAWLLPQRGQWSCSFRQNMVAAGSKATFALVSGVIEATSEVAAELLPCPPPHWG